MAAQLVPGTPVFIQTLLTSPAYTNVTGGQYVMNVKQAGNVVVFVSGQGSRSTLTQSVSPGGVEIAWLLNLEKKLINIPAGSCIHWRRCSSH